MPYEKHYFLLGNPFLYEEGLADAGFTPLEIIPLNIPNKFYPDMVFKCNFDNLVEVEDIPRLKVYPRPYSLTYQIDHELSSSIFEEAMGYSSRIAEITQALNISEALDSFSKKLIAGIFGVGGGNLLGTIGEVVRRRMVGYIGVFPRIWRGSSMDYGLRLEVNHSIYSYSDPGEEYKNLLNIIGKYAFPRSSTEEEAKRESEEYFSKTGGQTTEGAKQAENDSSTKLYNLMYKYPYFVRVLNYKTKGKIIDAGMITHCTIEAQSDKFLWSGIPSEVTIVINIAPFLPIIMNASDEDSNKFFSVKNWSNELSKTTNIEEPFSKEINKLSEKSSNSFNFIIPKRK